MLAVILRVLFLVCISDFTSAGGAGGKAGEKRESVGKMRSSAEVAMSEGDVNSALQLWEKVIKMEPRNEQNYFKRFRLFLRQQKFKEALADLNSALAIKPDHEIMLSQRAKLNLKMGNCAQAVEDFTILKTSFSSNKDISMLEQAIRCNESIRQGDEFYKRKEWSLAAEHFSVAIKFADNAPSLLYKRALSAFHVGDTYEAIADLGKILKSEGDNLSALELRGNCYYVLNELDMAMNHYRKALKYDPEHKGCKEGYRLVKRVQGLFAKVDKAIEEDDHEIVIQYLFKLQAIDPEHQYIVPLCYIQLANSHRELKKFNDAKKFAQNAIDWDARRGVQNSAYHLAMGRIHMDCEEYEMALTQFSKAAEIDGGENREIREEIHKAEVAIKQSKQKDHYKTLGVSRKAKQREIKKAYRDLALRWHPDKHADDSEQEKERATIEFQKIAEAYEVLSDEERRSKYDRGEEVESNQGGGHHQGFNPFQNMHFQGGRPFGGQHFQFHF